MRRIGKAKIGKALKELSEAIKRRLSRIEAMRHEVKRMIRTR
jgi:hypothetical protein